MGDQVKSAVYCESHRGSWNLLHAAIQSGNVGVFASVLADLTRLLTDHDEVLVPATQ